MLWFALVIPFIGNLVKRFRYHKRTLWWEYIVDYAVAIPVILLLKFTMTSYMLSDTEFLGHYVEESWYYEGWDEWIQKTCERTTGYDKDGNAITEVYDCSYEEDHAPYVEFHLNTGSKVKVAQGGTGGLFEFGSAWAKKRFPVHDNRVAEWGNEKEVDMRRWHNGTDGDAFVTRYNGEPSKVYPWSTKQRYSNPTQVARSLFDFPEVDDSDVEKYGLFDYAPLEDHQQQQIQGAGGHSMAKAERKLQIANALLGSRKQVRIFILVFKNQPLEASFKQEGYWQGGNKNEFTLTLGVNDSGQVTWARAFTWSDVKSLEVDLRGFIGDEFIDSGRQLDLLPIVEWMHKHVGERWVRKEFSEFNYITADPPWQWILLTFIVVSLINLGTSAWSVVNQFHAEEKISYRDAIRRLWHPDRSSDPRDSVGPRVTRS